MNIFSYYSDFAICPFTMDPDRAGIPLGAVRYTISRAVTPEEAFLAYWKEVQATINADEKDISTVLLVFPELELFGNYELFESYCESLSDALSKTTMSMEAVIQLVFFHPKYQFRDGQARVGEEKGKYYHKYYHICNLIRIFIIFLSSCIYIIIVFISYHYYIIYILTFI